jgi:hypothetical protein
MHVDSDFGPDINSHFGLDGVSRDHPFFSGTIPDWKFDDRAGILLVAIHHRFMPFTIDCGFWSFLFD